MDTIGERIRKRREHLGMTQDELAKKLGYKSRSSINKIELNERNLTQSKIVAIANALETTPSYVMGWEEENYTKSGIDNIISLPRMKKIPLLGTIACGEPILATENLDGEVDIPENIHADFALRCKGDSMIEARIMDGDIVYIRQQPTVDNGEIAAVLIGDEATLKRVYITENMVTLMPCNPKYPPMVYTDSELEDVRIIGKAVSFTSKVE